jgi:hypothetical protein
MYPHVENYLRGCSNCSSDETVQTDREFDPLRGGTIFDAMQASLNTTSNDKHISEAERLIRTVKDRSRCVYTTVPFKCMPTCMTVELVYASVFWLNMFPATNGVSNTISPRGLISDLKLYYGKHCRIKFGVYVQHHGQSHDRRHRSPTHRKRPRWLLFHESRHRTS